MSSKQASPSPPATPAAAPSRRRALIEITLCVVVLRIAVSIVLAAGEPSLEHHLRAEDGRAYLQYARAIQSQEFAPPPDGPLEAISSRMFPLFPVLLALAGLPGWALGGVAGLGLTGIALNVIGAWAATLGTYLWTGDLARTRYLYAFTPAWLEYTSKVMSEGWFLALVVATFWLLHRRRPGWAGLAAGAAATVRPFGAFAALGVGVACLAARDGRGLVRAIVGGAVFPAAMLGFSALAFGDPLHPFSVYSAAGEEQAVAAPFAAFASGFQQDDVRGVISTGAYLLLALGILGLQIARVRRSALDLGLLVYAAATVLFVASLSTEWSYLCFNRYTVGLLPVLVWAGGAALTAHRATGAAAEDGGAGGAAALPAPVPPSGGILPAGPAGPILAGVVGIAVVLL